MYRPPLDPRDRPPVENPTWRRILVSYALIAVVFFLFWAVSQPLVGVVVLAAVVGVSIVVRRAHRLVRCFYDCQGLAFEFGETARITVSRIPTDEAN